MWKYLVSAFLLRMFLIIYGEFHDKISEVPYTDVDYRVFTDASRYILNNKSPYDRHTYRYTPLIAFLLIPNILFTRIFGKILFSIIDVIVGVLIRNIVIYNQSKYTKFKTKSNESHAESSPQKSLEKFAENSMLFWLFNPLSIAISTRGNCDSIAVLLVLLTLYLLQCKEKYFFAGIIHGIAIHIRLYPIIYSLSYFMYLSKFGQYSISKKVTHTSAKKALIEAAKKKNELVQVQQNLSLSMVDTKNCKTIFKKDYLLYLIPNFNQLQLIVGCLLSFISLTTIFYYLYGYEFLYETYLFHLARKDTRHNFSMFFYIQYLTAGIKNIGIWQKVLSVLPQIVLLLVLSVRYGLNKFTLPFSILTQTIVMVAYNSVLTSQYFVWILAVLPLTLWQFRMSLKTSVVLLIVWFAAQLAWLFPAYLLEFHGQNTFLFIWVQSVSFFCANMAILGRLIKCYMYKVD